ncbi:MAG: carboxypeptidase regulatory-like domain-containing protein [Bacteroidales bacterium]|nr:carboxypeptidase regulatory-like domain-containing protein [Bacteroidales bacterium]MCF8402716.1 carboxypeptidase regulatory-like domain-containing protein [Bacteroidales bacterium]
MLRSIFYSLIILLFTTGTLYSQSRPMIKTEKIKRAKFDETIPLTPKDTALCIPEYSTGCGMGDGFTDFAVEEIQNYGSGCADNTGYEGWSQYLDMGPAFLIPGLSHDFIMKTGYNNQNVSIWIDFNNDYILTSDEMILYDFELGQAGQFYTASVEIPLNATPGMHIMRARTNWSGSCDDPCESYTYGEAEDYYVILGTASFGTLQGTVTEFTGGAPIENAEIILEGLIDYTLSTGSGGYYMSETILAGDYEVSCSKTGYHVQTTSITILEDETLTLNFQLTHPEINVSPLSINVELEPNTTTSEQITIENNGDGDLNWAASLQLTGKGSKDFLDLQFEYPAVGGSGEAGIESDGNFIYTTNWNDGDIHQYDLQGNYISSFFIPGVAALRDLAFDGNYFYGSAGIPLVYEMDFVNHELIGTFSTSASIRAIAYNDGGDFFYGNNWNDPIILFDKSGNTLSSMPIGPEGENYYGFAFDMASPGSPYLWGYAQTGNSNNEIIQIQLPSGTETGLTIDIEDKINGTIYNSAGGLFTHSNIIFGKWTLSGIVQTQWIWGLELGDAVTWLSATPNTGILPPGQSEVINANMDASNLPPGVYNAQILFNTYPEVGTPLVEIELTVAEHVNPCNLTSTINCTNIHLQWEMCPADTIPDNYNVYRNGSLISTTSDMDFTDVNVFPDSTYGYFITAIFAGNESWPSNTDTIFAAMPENLVPENFSYIVIGNNIELNWNTPSGCLIPDGFNIYRDNTLIGFTMDTSFTDQFGFYQYTLTAVYYFGESDPTEPLNITSTNEIASDPVSLYPNPAKDHLFVRSDKFITSWSVYSHDGRLLLGEVTNTNRITIGCTMMGSGIYFLELEIDGKTYSYKFLVKK